jgi:hypothetical protein
MNYLENVTVCITSFKRSWHLDRALQSVRDTGIRRVTIAAVCATTEVMEIIAKHDHDWLSYDVSFVWHDIGCNATWLLAAYQARTDHIIILHDDDTLLPELGRRIADGVGAVLGQVGWVTWQADHLFDDGRRKPCPYWHKPSNIYPADDLLAIVGQMGRLSLSPVVSILNRDVVIAACKEAEQTLTHNACLHHPGMLLGTEILVYLRHIGRFETFLYIDEPLSCYGYHDGSGTIKAEESSQQATLTIGYDMARMQSQHKPPAMDPRIILCWSDMAPKDEGEAARFEAAWFSWQHLFGTGQVIPCPVDAVDAPDTPAGVPFARQVIDAAFRRAMPEDIILYINRDNGLTTHAPERIIAGIARGRGACACPRRNIEPQPHRLYRSVKNCRTTGGFDAFAMTPQWWIDHREEMPEMLIAREAWDTVLRTLMHEKAVGHKITTEGEVTHFITSPACCDDVCWHTEHMSRWQIGREKNLGNIHNLVCAYNFYIKRGIKFASPSLPLG